MIDVGATNKVYTFCFKAEAICVPQIMSMCDPVAITAACDPAAVASSNRILDLVEAPQGAMALLTGLLHQRESGPLSLLVRHERNTAGPSICVHFAKNARVVHSYSTPQLIKYSSCVFVSAGTRGESASGHGFS